MPLKLVRNDITKMKVDAIVNAANETLLGGGGVDGAIHRAAGPELQAQCRTLGGCRPGQAKATPGYRLPAKYVIHTVGPVWHGGLLGEKRVLQSCYRACLALARQLGCESVAFPLISAGVYGYPKDKALRVAVDAVSSFLTEQDMTVYLVMFDKSAFQISSRLFSDIQSFIDDQYVQLHRAPGNSRELRMAQAHPTMAAPREMCAPMAANARSLEDMLDSLDESFSQMPLRKIDESGISDAQCYKKANIDRKLFSQIRSDPHYRPSKPTVLAFAIALRLDIHEARDMLQKAGFALSHASKFDIIVEYCIRNGIYDIYRINEILFAFDQSLLGG